MARICSSCKYYTTGDETTCPKCKCGLQFTLLPPPGQAALPLAIDPGTQPLKPRARDLPSGPSWSVWDLFKAYRASRALLAAPIALVMILGGVFLGWGKDNVYNRFDRIQIGMTEKEVRDVLTPPRRGRHPTPEWYNKPMLSTQGFAEMNINEAGLNLHLEFMDGRLTYKSVEAAEDAEQ
jgi:hypothetical protein